MHLSGYGTLNERENKLLFQDDRDLKNLTMLHKFTFTRLGPGRMSNKDG